MHSVCDRNQIALLHKQMKHLQSGRHVLTLVKFWSCHYRLELRKRIGGQQQSCRLQSTSNGKRGD